MPAFGQKNYFWPAGCVPIPGSLYVMLQVSVLREQKEHVLKGLKVKNVKDLSIVDEIIRLDDERKSIQNQSDQLANEAKVLAAKIGDLMKAGRKEEAEQLKAKTTGLKESGKE